MMYGKVQKQYSHNITAICTLPYMHNVIILYNSTQSIQDLADILITDTRQQIYSDTDNRSNIVKLDVT